MPRTKKVMRRGKARKGRAARINPSASTLIYRGPIIVDRNQSASISRTLSYALSVSTTGLGSLIFNITNDPSGSYTWTSYAAAYEEYRVLGMHVDFQPILQNFSNTSGLALSMGLGLVHYATRDSSYVPASLSAAISFPSARLTNIQKAWKREIRMSGTNESQWTNTSSPGNTFGVGIFANGLTATTQYGVIAIRLLCQFRAAI